MNDATQPTPEQTLAIIEDMCVKRMLGIFDALCKQNGLVLMRHDVDMAQCILATVAHETAPLAAELALGAPQPSSLIVPGGGS